MQGLQVILTQELHLRVKVQIHILALLVVLLLTQDLRILIAEEVIADIRTQIQEVIVLQLLDKAVVVHTRQATTVEARHQEVAQVVVVLHLAEVQEALDNTN